MMTRNLTRSLRCFESIASLKNTFCTSIICFGIVSRRKLRPWMDAYHIKLKCDMCEYSGEVRQGMTCEKFVWTN